MNTGIHPTSLFPIGLLFPTVARGGKQRQISAAAAVVAPGGLPGFPLHNSKHYSALLAGQDTSGVVGEGGSGGVVAERVRLV